MKYIFKIINRCCECPYCSSTLSKFKAGATYYCSFNNKTLCAAVFDENKCDISPVYNDDWISPYCELNEVKN